ncbi:DUF1330 domain-containing protein [Amycolatopsis sp. CA-126428]|uniref:DUF1330 domain-containing protein n=1 Tax=Amycolatopsis sp. CA-126428 TaxID=2073158 RepID=UPI000CD25C0E|nr:DUF1330 domain-containing protein [Amycolatopsis sp. CA-126428]
MPKGYWVNQSDITDPEKMSKYSTAVREFLGREGARTLFITDYSRYEVVEGSPRSRQLVQEFPSYEAALSAYRSAEYQAIRKLRRDAALLDLLIVEGLE